MPLSALTGARLREHRLAAGLRQADVAGAAGISPSYLNLIEHGRRKVTPQVLERLADALGLDRAALLGGREVALAESLRAALARAGSSVGADLDRVEDFASRFPGWAGLLVQLDARAEGLERAVEALNDRMSHDPHLSQALHEVLSSLSSVRATAAILAETADLPADWAARFHQNLHQDSERLAAGAEALVAYLDAGNTMVEQGIAAPQEEVEEWLRSRDWALSDAELGRGCEDDVATLASSAARSLARGYVARARADAETLPEGAFADALARIGPDPVALADAFGTDPLVAMRRLAGQPGVGAGLVTCDGSGALTFRKPAPGFPLPRFGSACALWPLYTALGRPMQPVEALVDISGQGGQVYRVTAWSRVLHPMGLRGPELREAAMLILPPTIPSGAPGSRPELTVGSSCRVCPRGDCPARREPSILSATA